MADPIDVIQTTLSPIFLVTGSSIFLTFIQERLGRVRDLLRVGVVEDESMYPESTSGLLHRSEVLHYAVILSVLCIAFTMASALSLLLPVLFTDRIAGTTALWTFAAAIITLTGSAALTAYDAILASNVLHTIVRRNR